MINNKEILITGGTGTLGKELVLQLKRDYKPRGIRIYSRDEEKHRVAKGYFQNNGISMDNISFIIGDISNYKDIKRAMKDVDIVIHAAAMKQVPACEDNPIEAIRINIIGAENIVMAAWENKIEQVINIATDKGTGPVNIYGMTKGLAEKMIIFGSVYTGGRQPFFKSCRYGNVIGSRGSILPVWEKQIEETGKITITARGMTRFFIPLSKVAKFVLDRIGESENGMIYVPKMKSIDIGDFADIIHPGIEKKCTGIRPGEKIHETIIGAEESHFTEVRDKYYAIHAGAMKLHNTIITPMENALQFCELNSYNNPERWGPEIKEYCEVK